MDHRPPLPDPCLRADTVLELREQVYRDEMTGKDAAAELQTRADAEWAAQGLQ